MKKFLIRLATCVLTLLCVLGLASCNEPELDFVDAKANLEVKGYEVTVGVSETQYGVEEVLTATKGVDYIYIYRFKESSVAKKYYNGQLAQAEVEVDAMEAQVEYLEALLEYHRAEMSSTAIAMQEREIKSLKAEIEEYKEKIENTGRSGRYVWEATKYAIEDSK